MGEALEKVRGGEEKAVRKRVGCFLGRFGRKGAWEMEKEQLAAAQVLASRVDQETRLTVEN